MKNILQLLCISLVVGAVMAGMAGTEIYNPVFYGPVAIGQWNAVSNFAGVAATNGAYTNSVTYQYRLTATNSLGRLPYTVTNSVVIDGAMNHSAHLTWTYTPRVSCYVLERGTTGTWDQFVRIGASLTNAWDDGSSLLWMNGNYAATNECALSDFPTGSIPVVGITAGTFYDGAQGDAVSNAVSGLTNDVAVLQTNTATKAQGALADTALQVEADTNALFQLNAHATNVTNPHAVTAAQIGAATGSPLYEFAEVDPAYATGGVQRIDTNGWVVSAHEAWLTAEVDPAYATGAVQLAGATMTGPMTNEFGYFGNGSGLTNLASDPSGWSGYAATQQVVWYSDEIADDTNYLVISGSSEPETAGLYQWANSNEVWAYWKGGDKVAPQGEDFWYIFTPLSEFRNASNDPTAGGYDAYFNATGTILAAYGKMTNTIPWRAGYDTNSTHWAISCNGTNIQEWSRTSNFETVYTIIKGNLHVDNGIEAGALQAETFISAPAYYLNGVYRETWPSEYDDSTLAGNLSVVSNWAVSVSNDVEIIKTNYTQLPAFTAHTNNEAADIQHLTEAEKAIATNQSPYQPFSATVEAVDGTATVVYASGSLVRIVATNDITTLAFDSTDYPTSGVSRVAVELWADTNSIAFDSTTINTNDFAPTISSNDWNSFFFRRSGTNLWTGRY